MVKATTHRKGLNIERRDSFFFVYVSFNYL